MKKFYDKALIETYLKQTKYESIMSGLQEHLFVVNYEKSEFVTMPLQQVHLFQIIIQGTVRIYLSGMMGRCILLQPAGRMIYSVKWKFSNTSQATFMRKQMMM